ncbi:glycerophosphodiester phosphodiesterase [Desulfuribacillus stibiiarsenatis]|uniref:Glycerophosphodiester phosphodiesterase n=1 Tax=Desulfuribacillus stibiiarsenatis TaxID=1390249 RepID=A0A1E5L4H1_9FIRM|nr:glycerophosphodiester phosphodiesterase family protein [Desulfuribacillus stibiiarsenatis]OEH84986.1 glycerophosphodiester phosphodiesterase [Desulfuribacillus stibiiarsenatis]
MNICMAHRGWSSIAPENTMAAIELAVNDTRIQAVEIDVHLTKDNIPVVIHDYTLNRTTNGKGFVKQYTYDEIRYLDAGSWFSEEFRGQRIPTLEEVLLLVRGRCHLNIEIKSLAPDYRQIEQPIISLIDRYRMSDEVMITSFNHELIRYINLSQRNRVTTGIIVAGRPLLLPAQLIRSRANVLSMEYPFITKEMVDALLSRNYQVVAWTVDDPEDIASLMQMSPGVQICTNCPQNMFPFMNRME